MRFPTTLALTAAMALGGAAPANSQFEASTPGSTRATLVKQGYETVNGLKMYYEIHGNGRPLVLLHGGFMSIDAMAPLLTALARDHQVIAVELEGHGRTADLPRPLSYDQMADDVAELLGQIGIKEADFFGFSMGGATALKVAIRHPNVVRRLVVASVSYKKDGFYPSVTAMWPGMSPDGFKGTPMEAEYMRLAPDKSHWPVFVNKMKTAMLNTQDWPAAEIESIKAPTLLLVGDADLIRPEHAVEMFHLLGGAQPDGGMGGIPTNQLAVVPGTSHFTMVYRIDLLIPIVTPFLDGYGEAK